MTKQFFATILASSALSLSASAQEPEQSAMDDAAMADQTANAEATRPGTVVDIAVENPDFSTLEAAVQAAGLVETLSGPGPFTVFAPTDEAFGALPESTVETLTTQDTGQLASILTYHVVPSEVMAADLIAAIESAGADGYSVSTVNSGTLTATLVDGNVMLTDAAGNSATVTATDTEASNGVIDVIDTVLMPG